MAGFFPGEGEDAKLKILVGQVPQPDLYMALWTDTAHAVDHNVAFGDLTQPADPSYSPVLLNPLLWVVTSGTSDPTTALSQTCTFYFAEPATVMGYFVYCDIGAGPVILEINYLNPFAGVTIPTGGAALGVSVTFQDFSVAPPGP